MKFELTENQNNLYKTWAEKHTPNCRYYDSNLDIRNIGLGGTPDTFCFNPSVFGDIVIIKCACGEEIDVTEWDGSDTLL